MKNWFTNWDQRTQDGATRRESMKAGVTGSGGGSTPPPPPPPTPPTTESTAEPPRSNAASFDIVEIKPSNNLLIVIGFVLSILIGAACAAIWPTPQVMQTVADALPDPMWEMFVPILQFLIWIATATLVFFGLGSIQEIPARHMAILLFLGGRIRSWPIGGKLVLNEGPVWVPRMLFGLLTVSMERQNLNVEVSVPSKDMIEIKVKAVCQYHVEDPFLWTDIDIEEGGSITIKNRLNSMVRKVTSIFNFIDMNDLKGVFEEILKGSWYLVGRHVGEKDSVSDKGNLIRNKANSPRVERISEEDARDHIKREAAKSAFRTKLEKLNAENKLSGFDSDDSVEVVPSPDLLAEGLHELMKQVGVKLDSLEITDITGPQSIYEAAAKVAAEVFEGRATEVENTYRSKRIVEIIQKSKDKDGLGDPTITFNEAWAKLLIEDKKATATFWYGNIDQFEKLFNSIASEIAKRSTKVMKGVIDG